MIRIGSWGSIPESSIAEYIESGSVISSSASVQHEVELCNPVHLSPQVQVKSGCRLDKFTFVNWNSVLYPNVHIGAYCSIGRGVQIGLAKHPTTWLSTHSFQYSVGWFPEIESYKKINRTKKHLHHPKTIIGHDVWVGNNALIMSGIRIGTGAIIGAGAVVTKDVEPFAIVLGQPARFLRYRFTEGQIRDLLASKWWSYNPDQLTDISFHDISLAIEQLKLLKK